MRCLFALIVVLHTVLYAKKEYRMFFYWHCYIAKYP